MRTHKSGGWERGDMMALTLLGEVWIVLGGHNLLEITPARESIMIRHFPENLESHQYIGNIKDVCAALGVDCIDISCYNIKEDK